MVFLVQIIISFEIGKQIWQKLFGAVFEGKTQVTQYSLTGGMFWLLSKSKSQLAVI